ncbi:MAG: low molecular weight phosphotyrosine protein phosphatase [Chloroflexi bacterium]|nr:low molecular weight phosphotyrosine protein phosphatase [Chloroflexota bacterium]
MIRVLFVCHGNICRSPMADAVMTHLVREAGLSDRIAVDSAGTHGWHIGEPPHRHTVAVLNTHGIKPVGAARQLRAADFDTFDYMLAMDRHNLDDMVRFTTAGKADVRLLLHDLHQLGHTAYNEVIDPYPNGDFDQTFRDIYAACAHLLDRIRDEHGL